MQKSRIFSLEPRSRELFACQKPVFQKPVFSKPVFQNRFFKNRFFFNRIFLKFHRKIMKIRVQIPEFREESISDHPGGQN